MGSNPIGAILQAILHNHNKFYKSQASEYSMVMQIREKKREEVEARLSSMSDFLKMEYLENCLKQTDSLDIKKFSHTKLTELYMEKSMYAEAARNMSALADISITFKEKIEAFMKETELWIKAGNYDRADDSLKKALACGNKREKGEIKLKIKEIYQKQAEAYKKNQKNGNAMRIYEKMLTLELSDEEKLEIKKKLLLIYGKLGKIREQSMLRKGIGTD